MPSHLWPPCRAPPIMPYLKPIKIYKLKASGKEHNFGNCPLGNLTTARAPWKSALNTIVVHPISSQLYRRACGQGRAGKRPGCPSSWLAGGAVMLSEPLSPLLLHEEHATCFFAHSFKSLCGWHLEKYRLQPDLAILMTALEIPSFSQQHLLSAPHPCHQRAFPTQVVLQIERISDVHVWLPPLKASTNIQVVNSPRETPLVKLVQIFRRKQTWHRHDTWELSLSSSEPFQTLLPSKPKCLVLNYFFFFPKPILTTASSQKKKKTQKEKQTIWL